MKIVRLLFLLLFVFVACKEQETVISLPTSTPSNIESVTNTPAPDMTPVANELGEASPSAEPTPIPTELALAEPTVIPSKTPRPTATGEPTPTGIYLDSAEQFVEGNRNPLTGEVVEDLSVLNRRPILCKIFNSPKECVRPQSGLNSADIVLEHYAEGAITRFSAIFYGHTPKTAGPVRSARLVDLELVPAFDAALCFSGASIGVSERIYTAPFLSRVMNSDEPGFYRTGENKPYEHTLYNRLGETWQKLDERGQNTPPQYNTSFVFSSEIPEPSALINYISIRYGKGTFVEWKWDEEIQKYRRWADDEPLLDALTGEQITADNIIIVRAHHFIDRNICEMQTETECLAFSTEIWVWGKGYASIFRNGRQIDGEWRQEDRGKNGSFFNYFYPDGIRPIPLQIGNSWIQVVPYAGDYIDTEVITSSELP